MKVTFESWFNRKCDDEALRMWAINFTPSISLIYETNGWYSFSIQFLFWSLTFEKTDQFFA